MVEAAKKLPVKRISRKPAAFESVPTVAAPITPVEPIAKTVDSAPAPVEARTRKLKTKAEPIKVAAEPVEAPAMKASAKPTGIVRKPREKAAAPVEAVVETVPTPADPIELIEAVTSPAAPSDTITDAPSAPILEGLEDMATTSPTQNVGIASEKLQSMFGDVGARFKASFDKSSKLGEEMVELTKGNVEAVVASARVAAKGSEALGQDAAEYGKKSLETAVAAMKSFASVKSPTELFQLQSDYAKSSFDSMVAEASKFSESMMKLAGDVAQPLSTRYAVAAEKIKAAAL